HYLGFAATQWRLFEKEDPPRVKPLLYLYRVLLTGIHLMRTGQIEANLVTLNEDARLPFISDLVARKVHGVETSTLEAPDRDFHRNEYNRLTALLEHEASQSKLPEEPTCREALNDLLIRVRIAG
ncbi:MAG TPA: nucleotidyltransferase domain-containing protein, partial [Bryobacteraceae bacterium]